MSNEKRRTGSAWALGALALAVTVGLFVLPTVVTAWQGPGNPLDPFEREVVNLVNQERTSRGIPALIVNYSLQEAAWKHTEHMARRRVMCHQGCGDGDPASRIAATGYVASTWGENVASGHTTPAEVMDAWMHSSGHRANILNSAFTDIGVAYASGGRYGTSWTQVFARPRDGVPTVTPPPGSGDPGSKPRVCQGLYDFNSDCEVNQADLDDITGRFLAKPGDARWEAKYDVIQDSEINVLDVFAVVLAMADAG